MKKEIKGNLIKKLINPFRRKSLLEKFPELCRDWDYEKNYPLTPKDISYGSNKMVSWKCKKCGHEWEASPHQRSAGYKNCRICSCLATLNPRVASEWHPTKNGKLTPFDVTYSSGKKVWWTCKYRHEWNAMIDWRRDGNNCPYCSGKKVCKDNCLSTINPWLSAEWDFERNGTLTPNDFVRYSHKKAHWKCKKCGYRWVAKISDRSTGQDCPCCKKHKVELKNGVICDSKSEAYYWLELDRNGTKFKHHVRIGLGQCVCDFYIPTTNTYIEVTGYSRQWEHWKTYKKNILRKKSRIINTLKANFKLVQLKLTPKQFQYVRENMA